MLSAQQKHFTVHRAAGLQQLYTSIKDFETNAGSNTIFDYRNTDPLANTHIGTMLKHDGAKLTFVGATGDQHYDVANRFLDGSTKQINNNVNDLAAASGSDSATRSKLMDDNLSALHDQFSTLDDVFAGMNQKLDEKKLVLLII